MWLDLEKKDTFYIAPFVCTTYIRRKNTDLRQCVCVNVLQDMYIKIHCLEHVFYVFETVTDLSLFIYSMTSLKQ